MPIRGRFLNNGLNLRMFDETRLANWKKFRISSPRLNLLLAVRLASSIMEREPTVLGKGNPFLRISARIYVIHKGR